MLGSSTHHAKRRTQVGGIVAAIQMARKNNPNSKPLPEGFFDHAKCLEQMATPVDAIAKNVDEVVGPVFRAQPRL